VPATLCIHRRMPTAFVTVFGEWHLFVIIFIFENMFFESCPHFDLATDAANNSLKNFSYFNYIFTYSAYNNHFSRPVTIFLRCYDIGREPKPTGGIRDSDLAFRIECFVELAHVLRQPDWDAALDHS
jgi:hypothetical protein